MMMSKKQRDVKEGAHFPQRDGPFWMWAHSNSPPSLEGSQAVQCSRVFEEQLF